MHILLIHQVFTSMDEPGGTRHLEMAQHLSHSGHKITIIASSVSYLTGNLKGENNRWCQKEILQPGITILRTYTFQALHRSFFHRLISFLSFMISSFFVGLSVKNVDVLWGTSPPIFQALTAWLLARIKRARFLFEVRDLWPAFAIAVGVLRNPFLILLSNWLEKFLYTHADCLVLNSPGFVDFVEAKGAKNIYVVPNGVDVHMFDGPENRKVWQNFGIENKFIILYAGAHGLSNDLGIVLQAAEILNNEPDIQFVLVGDGKEKANLIQQAAEKKLSNVLFLPATPKSEMSEVIKASDACLAILKPLDLFRTTYPNKVFDYMACSKPVLLAIDGVIRQVVEEAQAGIFVPPGNPQALADAIFDLKNHDEKRVEMGHQGRIYVERYFGRAYWTDYFMKILESMSKENG